MEWQFFEIGFKSLNLLSFMLGMIWAFFNQGLFGKRIGKWIMLYLAGLAMWYGMHFYSHVKQNTEQKSPVEVTEPNKKVNNVK